MIRALLLAALLASPVQAGDWRTYKDPAGRFTIRLPPGWKANPKFVDRGYGSYQGEPDDKLAGTSFSTKAGLAPGTNLERTLIVVEALPKGRKCVADEFLVDPPPDYFTTVQEQTDDHMRTTAEPGDLYGEEHDIYVVSHHPCVAAHYIIGYGQMNEIRAKTEYPFDRERLFTLFDKIRATVVVNRPPSP